MDSYLRVVGQAVLFFPVASALIALPFLLPSITIGNMGA